MSFKVMVVAAFSKPFPATQVDQSVFSTKKLD